MFWNKNKTVTISGTTTICANTSGENTSEKIITKINEATETPADEWVEITGYKGMDKNMICYNNFKYEIGIIYTINDPNEVDICEHGYHLCLKLEEVLNYYNDPFSDRYFKVSALVKKSHLDRYSDKIAARKIEIIKEISLQEKYELYKNNADRCLYNFLPLIHNIDDFKSFSCKTMDDVRNIISNRYSEMLCDLGYSKTFSIVLANDIDPIDSTFSFFNKVGYSINYDRYEKLYAKAKAFKEEGLSPDMCAYLLLK